MPRSVCPYFFAACDAARRQITRLRTAWVWLAAGLGLTIAALPVAAQDPVSFKQHIAPVLRTKCLECHTEGNAEGGYRVDSYQRLLKPGESEKTPVNVQDVASSELFRRITSEDESERMPAESEALDEAIIATFRKWVTGGAKYDGEDPTQPLIELVAPSEYPAAPKSYPRAMPITALSFDPSGTRLLTSGYHEICEWSLDGQLQHRQGNIGRRTEAIRFDRGGRNVAIASGAPGQNGEVRIFDYKTWELRCVAAKSEYMVLDVSFDGAGKRLATAGADATVRLVNATNGKALWISKSHSDWVHSISWNAAGDQLVSASRDKTSKLIDAADGRTIRSYPGHEQAVHVARFSPDSQRVYSGDVIGKVHIWSVDKGEKKKELAAGGSVIALQIEKSNLLVAASNRTLRQVSLDKHEVIRKFEALTDWPTAMAIDHGQVAIGTHSGTVYIWDLKDGTLKHQFLAKP